MGWILGGMLTASLACGGNGGNGSSDGGPPTQPPNPCATPSTSYGASISARPGDSCISSIVVPVQFCDEKIPCVIDVNANGTLDLPTNVTCASFSVTGCTTRGGDCTYTSDGQSFTESFEITFAEEGVAATGTVSVTGMGNGVAGMGSGPSCSSTYDVSASRP